MCFNPGLDSICVEEMSLVLKKELCLLSSIYDRSDCGSGHFLLIEVVINDVEDRYALTSWTSWSAAVLEF